MTPCIDDGDRVPSQIDPDLPSFEAPLRSLLEERDRNDRRTAAPSSPAVPLDSGLQLRRRFRQAVEGETGATRTELQELLTDACAERLAAELARLRAKRRLFAAVADFSADSATPGELRELSRRYRLIEDEIERLAEVIVGVRARLTLEGSPRAT